MSRKKNGKRMERPATRPVHCSPPFPEGVKKINLSRHPGENRGPVNFQGSENTGVRLSPAWREKELNQFLPPPQEGKIWKIEIFPPPPRRGRGRVGVKTGFFHTFGEAKGGGMPCFLRRLNYFFLFGLLGSSFAAASIASTMFSYPVQRQRFPAIPSRIS